MVEKIPSKDVAPLNTSQTIAKPLAEIQSHPTSENGGEEETRKKEWDTAEEKDTRVGPLAEAEMAVQLGNGNGGNYKRGRRNSTW